MSTVRMYGIPCSSCGRSVEVDRISLADGAQLADLHNALNAQDWKARTVICRRCNTGTLATVDRLIFLGGPAMFHRWRAYLHGLGLFRR